MHSKDVTSYQQLFNFISKNNGVAILDFHTQCQPCKLIEPYLQKYHKQTGVPLARISIQKSDDLVTKFNVNAVPTYILIKKSVGEIYILQTVVSAHVQKLKKLFEEAIDIRAHKK